MGSSYIKVNLLPFTNTSELVFIPQGIVMMFYGTLSFGLGIYILATIFWDIDSSFTYQKNCTIGTTNAITNNITIIAMYLDRCSSVFLADLKLLELSFRLTEGGPGSPLFERIDIKRLLASIAADPYCSSLALKG